VRNMGIKNKNGQSILVFACTQCKRGQQTDFRHYPLCKKCNVSNQRLAKRNINGHLEENKTKKKKKAGRKPTAYLENKDLCDRVGKMRREEGLTGSAISKILNEEGIKTTKGYEWDTYRVEWLYRLYKKNNDISS